MDELLLFLLPDDPKPYPKRLGMSNVTTMKRSSVPLLVRDCIRTIEQRQNYAGSIGTAVPVTTIPPEAGISTIRRLGRPIASP